MNRYIWVFSIFFYLFGVVGLAGAQNVSVNGEGGANATYGDAYLRSLSLGQGHGSFAVGQTIQGDWAAFHCTGAGTSPCATDLTPGEATKIAGGDWSVAVPAQNQRVQIGRHHYQSQACGRIQYDFGVNGVGTIGGWVHNFGSDCPAQVQPTMVPSRETCQDYLPVNTQFRISRWLRDDPWLSGSDLQDLKPGEVIDVNCFAKNGTALLPDARIEITTPVGTLTRDGAELRRYRLAHAGDYSFRCVSTTLEPVCADTDRLSVGVATTPTPTRTPTPVPTGVEHRASCDSLRVVSGGGAMAPASVEFETRASDNLGEIRRYRYHFGDGTVEEGERRMSHRYQTGGKFRVWVEVLDSRGNWRTSDECKTDVSLTTAPFVSHQSACTGLVIVSGNNTQAPARVVMEVSGFDNKGEIQKYRLDWGDGLVQEQGDRRFEHTYQMAGTYAVKAYVRDSKGEWVNGTGACHKSVQVLTKPVTKQPDTGAPLWALSLTGLSGMGGVGLWRWGRVFG